MEKLPTPQINIKLQFSNFFQTQFSVLRTCIPNVFVFDPFITTLHAGFLLAQHICRHTAHFAFNTMTQLNESYFYLIFFSHFYKPLSGSDCSLNTFFETLMQKISLHEFLVSFGKFPNNYNSISCV